MKRYLSLRHLAIAGVLFLTVLSVDPLGPAGADTTLEGYNASAQSIGAQFAFNVPGLVPLPNENLIEQDVPFSRTTLSDGPVVDSLGAPYYPGDIAADLGSLLITFGAPALPLNDPLLAQSKYPTSPGYTDQASFGIPPAKSTPAALSIFSSTADTSTTGGAATGTVSDLALDTLAKSLLNPSASASLLDIGNLSATNSVVLGAAAVTATSTAQIKALDVAGLIDISGLTSSATATSDGTTGSPSATLRLGAVTVDGNAAYIDGTGVHIASTAVGAGGITPAQLQESVDATLAQDGISISVLSPVLTTNGAQATANAGGLQISIAHQFDIPFIPGEPTIPIPDLGKIGLPAGLYTATTSITFGMAQASVNASGLSSEIAPLGSTGLTTTGTGTSSLSTLGSSFGSTFPSSSVGVTGGSVQSLAPSGPGSAPEAAPVPAPVGAATSFPIHGIPPPLGWTIAALLACILAAYPLLLLARWQFVAGRRP